ncbi:hypothetical protein LCGC14_1133920 [marine sediment metagenome]|uniref:Uncharacterized protein n=1 Tax=marine sediment metagenome TaxID=412755 RepID=A0A0F9MN83_9ZZZZ
MTCEKDITTVVKGDLTILRLGELFCIFHSDAEDALSIGKEGLLRGQKQLKESFDDV